MIDPDRQLELVPESVKLLLRPLLKSDIKIAFWEKNLIWCSRPRPGVVPVPKRFALQLDHRFGSKWLIWLIRVNTSIIISETNSM